MKQIKLFAALLMVALMVVSCIKWVDDDSGVNKKSIVGTWIPDHLLVERFYVDDEEMDYVEEDYYVPKGEGVEFWISNIDDIYFESIIFDADGTYQTFPVEHGDRNTYSLEDKELKMVIYSHQVIFTVKELSSKKMVLYYINEEYESDPNYVVTLTLVK